MHEFSIRSGWAQIEDFLNNPKANGDFENEILLSGYRPSPVNFGASGSGFSVELFTSERSKNLKYAYLLVIDLNSDIEVVAVSNLPDVIELLHKLSTIAESAASAEQRLSLEREAKEIGL